MDGPESETMPNPQPYDDRDDDSGQFRRQYPNEAFLDALDGRAFAATTDVAEAVGCSRETAYKTLQRLHDEGRVEKHNVGAAVAWSLADAENRESGDNSDGTNETESESL